MNIQMSTIFPSSIAILNAQQFLPLIKEVSKEWIEKVKQNIVMDPIYPVRQTENMVWDNRIVNFNEYVLAAATETLNKQGYDTNKFRLSIDEMWCQEHYKTSGHEKHVHNNGAVLSAFYMIECPPDSSFLLIYDPRIGKEYGMSLPEKNERELTEASNVINYGTTEGELIILNSFIPHGFMKNRSDKPYTFLHINMYADFTQQSVIVAENKYENKAIII